MAGIITALSFASVIIKAVTNSVTARDKKEIAANIIKATNSNGGKLVRTDGSITKLLSNFIIEPVIIATKGTKDIEIIDKLLEVNTDIFTSFYMQAFEILTKIYGVENSTAFEVLGTDNGGNKLAQLAFGKAGKLLSSEAANDTDYLGMLLSGNGISLAIEASETNEPVMNKVNVSNNGKFGDQPLAGILQRNIEINMTIRHTIDGAETRHIVSIPVTIKAHVLFVSTDNLLTMLAPNAEQKHFGYRLDEYRAGAISLSDLLFATDLIAKYKEDKLNDEQNLLSLINSRTLSANSKVLDKQMVGFEKSYNMLIITAEDKVLLDKHLNGNLTNEKYKQVLLEQANAMTCTVIDQDYERVYILTRDIRGRTDVTFKALAKRKDSGIDLSEVMKAMMSGHPPVF